MHYKSGLSASRPNRSILFLGISFSSPACMVRTQKSRSGDHPLNSTILQKQLVPFVGNLSSYSPSTRKSYCSRTPPPDVRFAAASTRGPPAVIPCLYIDGFVFLLLLLAQPRGAAACLT